MSVALHLAPLKDSLPVFPHKRVSCKSRAQELAERLDWVAGTLKKLRESEVSCV